MKKSAAEVAQAFKADLEALLVKHGASLESTVESSCECCGTDTTIRLFIKGTDSQEAVCSEVLGSWLYINKEGKLSIPTGGNH